jgi:hypothetical protein
MSGLQYFVARHNRILPLHSIAFTMKLSLVISSIASLATFCSSTILQNGQVRETHYPDTKIAFNSTGWKTYGPNATELSYKGRWDSQHISWWAAPGLKFGFDGNIAITFGPNTSPGVLIAYRVAGLDWQFTNVTANSTHQLVSPNTPGLNNTQSYQHPLTFEMRVTNWAYGVQIAGVHVDPMASLVKIPDHPKTIEFIGDSLTSGMYATYEAFSGFGRNIGAGFGNVEYSITAYPGICLVDAECWDNPRGQTYQWFQTSDTSPRAAQIYPNNPEPWDFSTRPKADIVLINLGTNDNNTHNNLNTTIYKKQYMEFIPKIHEVYPDAQIILMSLWKKFNSEGNTYREQGAFVNEIYEVYKAFADTGYVHYFNSTGILQHNDIGPGSHPTDVGHLKIAYSVMQYIRLKFGWEFGATGPEVQHDTLYWNDQSGY